ncbi:hypothetical protein Taro_012027 [Colocasia esculenta]|uniref:Uncharacterized protein n=1 Tax=Colocasia esculenta TaxID=4460 RepID=A0A843UCI6_COLES|nr:hypothetical protein [Colocasia esculenta]
MSTRHVVTVTWDPHPRPPARGGSPGGGRARVTDLERKGKRWGQQRRVICRDLLTRSGLLSSILLLESVGDWQSLVGFFVKLMPTFTGLY